MCYLLLLLSCLVSYRALAIEYAGVGGGYGHEMFKYYLDATTGTSESAVKKELNKRCDGKCDKIAITAQGDVQLCGAVGLKLDSWYVHSGSGYGRTRKEAQDNITPKSVYDKVKSICAPVAMDYRLKYGSQLVDKGFPQSVEKKFPTLITYLKDKDNNWNRNITAAIAGDSRNPSRYYFLLDNKMYIWFDDKDSKVHGPVSLEKSKDWPEIMKAVGANTIVAGFYYPPADKTYFFLSNNTCFEFFKKHITQPKPIADIFSNEIQKETIANKGLLTAFYDPDKKAYYFFFKNGKYIRLINKEITSVWNVDSHSWPGLDYDSFTHSKYYNKFVINTREKKIYDLVLRKAS